MINPPQKFARATVRDGQRLVQVWQSVASADIRPVNPDLAMGWTLVHGICQGEAQS